MTAEPAPATRVVTLVRAEHSWPRGYWPALAGLDVRIPALIADGRVLAGYLVAVRETDDTIELVFGDVSPEMAFEPRDEASGARRPPRSRDA